MPELGISIPRAREAATLQESWDCARGGNGRLVFVSGEAGVGKSRLVQDFVDVVAASSPVLTGWCDSFATPRPGGPIADIAVRLGGRLGDLLRSGQRNGLFDAVLTGLADCPAGTVLLVEDLHWADELTLDVLRFVGRRIAGLPVLLIGTYRDDEIGADHPLRTVLGLLAATPAVRRIALAPFTAAEVATLAAGSSVDPVALHERTCGNAFFVTEVLAAGTAGVPDTVSDAVAARVARLSEPARRALLAAAVVGPRAEPSIVLDLPGVAAAGLDECVALGLLTFVPPSFAFRHEVAREAVLARAALADLSELHRSALAALRAQPRTGDLLTRLAEHAEACGDSAAVLEFAPAAARLASGLGAHRAAARQLQRALRFAADAGAAERAELHEALAYELYLTADLDGATRARTAAADARRAAQQPLAVGDNLRWLARIAWYQGRRDDAETLVRSALHVLEPAGPSRELAMAYSTQSQLHMLAGDNSAAVDWGERALDLAARVNHAEARIHALNNVGTSRLAMGDAGGRRMLEASLAQALEVGRDDHVARAYVNLVAQGVKGHVRSITERYLDEAITWCEVRDVRLLGLYLQALKALELFHLGRWDEAEDLGRSLLPETAGSRINRFAVIVPLLRTAVRRGTDASMLLAEAVELARGLDESQGPVQPLFARAEAAYLAGNIESIGPELRAATSAASRHDILLRGELAFWRRKADPAATLPEPIVGPYARSLSADPAEAAAEWRAVGRPYEAALVLLDGNAEQCAEALRVFQDLGAQPAAALAARRLRESGVRRVPRGPRSATRAHPYGLTAREDEVWGLVARGLTNPDIAARMVLSERTVHHHVAAVLAKLGVATRREAARLAAQHEHAGTAS